MVTCVCVCVSAPVQLKTRASIGPYSRHRISGIFLKTGSGCWNDVWVVHVFCQVRASSKFLMDCTSLVGSVVIPLLRFWRILLETASFLQHLQFLDFLWGHRFRVIWIKGVLQPCWWSQMWGGGVYLGNLRVDDADVFLSLAQRGHVSQKLPPLLDLTQNCERKSGFSGINASTGKIIVSEFFIPSWNLSPSSVSGLGRPPGATGAGSSSPVDIMFWSRLFSFSMSPKKREESLNSRALWQEGHSFGNLLVGPGQNLSLT